MDSKDIKIIAIIAVALVAVIAVFTVTGADDSSKDDPVTPEEPSATVYGKITYEMKESSLIINKYGDIEDADLGKKFVIVTYTLENICYGSTLTASPSYLDLEFDGVRYNHDISTYSHFDYISVPEVTAGGSVKNVVVFQIDKSADISDMKVVWDGRPSEGIEVVPA